MAARLPIPPVWCHWAFDCENGKINSKCKHLDCDENGGVDLGGDGLGFEHIGNQEESSHDGGISNLYPPRALPLQEGARKTDGDIENGIVIGS